MKNSKKFLNAVIICLASASFAIFLWQAEWLFPWEAKTWDWRVRLMARPGKATREIVLIKLDQKSLDWASEHNGWNWPWPREVYAAVLRQCSRNGAKAVAFDVLFTEPSIYGVADDRAFGESLRSFGKAAVALSFNNTPGKHTEKKVGSGLHISGLSAWLEQSGRENLFFISPDLPIPEVSGTAAVLGSVLHKPDIDGISRRVNLFSVIDKTPFPCLGLGTFIAAHPETSFSIGENVFTSGKKTIPIDDSARTILRYRGPAGTYQTVSAAWVLQQEFLFMEGKKPDIEAKDLFRDKYVLFGFSAPGLFDLKSSPIDPVYSGLEIHATLLDNFLSNDFMRQLHPFLTALILILFSFLCAALIILYSGTILILSVLSGIILPIGLSFVFYHYGCWMPLVVIEVSVILTLFLSISVKYATEGRKKRYLKNAFKHYLSPHVINEIISHPEKLQLGGTSRTLSIFFSDLQGFTTISEGLSPEALTEFLNDYLSEMTDIILEEDGTVDKYEGDAIIAFWNAPLEVPDHDIRCVRAALRCQAKLAEMRPEFKHRLNRDVMMRIGINTGPAVVGNLGSRSRFDYTMLGDSVNLAARLEGVNKAFGTFTLVSEFTRDSIGDLFAFRELGRVAVVGRKEPVTIYEPMHRKQSEDLKPVLKQFSESLLYFYKGDFIKAEALFNRTAAIDPPSAKYAQRCRILIASQPAGWKGVWEMTEK